MAAPTFVNTGGAPDLGGAWTIANSVSVTTGNVVVFQLVQDGSTNGAVAATSFSGIAALDGTANSMTSIGSFAVGGSTEARQHLWIGRATSTTVSVSGTNSTSEDLFGQFYQFADVSAGTTLATVIENGSAGATTTSAGTSATLSDASVTTLGPDRLACNFIAVNDDNAIALITGQSGGTWADRGGFAASDGTDAANELQTAAMASAGTIDGGTASITDSDAWGVVGFALIGTTAAGTSATAGIATGTGAANRPSAHVKPNAGSASATGLARTPAQGRTAAVATATGAASQPSAHVKPSPAAAAATGAANRPSAGVKPSPAAATATGAANTPAQGRTAAVATATGAANRPAPNVKPTAGAASATGQAYDATASTATPATAGIATATGTANRPAAHVKPTPGAASATGQAYDATAAVGSVLTVNAGIASATGAANAVSAGVKPRPAVATATGAALTPSTARTAPTASAIAAAWGVTAKISVNASAATATGAANDATATDSGTPPPVVPPAGGRRRLQPQTRLEVHAGHATAHASAYGAGAWTDDSDTLLLTLLGITDFGVPL
jgi:hypothetical protein